MRQVGSFHSIKEEIRDENGQLVIDLSLLERQTERKLLVVIITAEHMSESEAVSGLKEHRAKEKYTRKSLTANI